MKNTDIQIEGLLAVAHWVNALILFGAVTCALVIASSIFGKREFQVQSIKVPLSYFPIVLFFLTIGHAFLTWLFVRKVSAIVALGEAKANKSWITLVNKGGLIFSEMEKREYQQDIGPLKITAYAIKETDPAAWLSVALAISAILAVVVTLWKSSRLSIPRFQYLCVVMLLGSGLAFANWFIASQWAISASSLAP